MRIIIGETSPTSNKRCNVTGQPFGPGYRRKRGYVVQKVNDGPTESYFAATKEAAYKIKEKLEENAN